MNLKNNIRGGLDIGSIGISGVPQKYFEDELPKLKKRKYFDQNAFTKIGSETIEVDNGSCNVPEAMLKLSWEEFSSILSLDTFFSDLDDGERDSLMALLPSSLHNASAKKVKSELESILKGDNVCFGNPSRALFDNFQKGLLHPSTTETKNRLLQLKRMSHIQTLREYHNDMVLSWVFQANGGRQR